ncbi:hypothetical protein CHCC20375_2153 [Bacillus licheniformis]|nr:hypothetical protein CHCC20375_2153 [Bacillus licheniformis]
MSHGFIPSYETSLKIIFFLMKIDFHKVSKTNFFLGCE